MKISARDRLKGGIVVVKKGTTTAHVRGGYEKACALSSTMPRSRSNSVASLRMRLR